MIREFLEYRPYATIAQFRREIGKYVDKHEVARLERYMFIAGAADAAGEKRDAEVDKDAQPPKSDRKEGADKKKGGEGKSGGADR